MNLQVRILRLIQSVELEPCRYKRMSMAAEMRELESQLNQLRER
ncbi:hypothetical protein PAAL109150_09895 [Paenibacillus alkaliterrae]